MHVFEVIIAMLLVGAGLTALSQRLGAPYPALLALAGAGLALVPGTPTLVLEPDLALALFVAPVLLDSAFDASARDLRANWRTIAGLAVSAVVVTVAVVTVVVRLLVPTMPWAVAITLGAIVAPTDAAAATAVLKQLRPPHRLLVILEGESLFNDASALLIYRFAVGVAVAGSLSPTRALPMLVVTTLGSVVLGYALSWLIVRRISRIHDVAIAVIVQFCSTFAVWLLAERLHLSGILTVVTYAMVTARRAAGLIPARVRIPSYAVWEFAVFALNVLAFILVGFQLKAILERIDAPTLASYAGIAAAVCGAAMVARLAYMAAVRLLPFRNGISARAAAGVGWAGMRGIVTLAAALALPTPGPGEPGFPFRDLIVFIAFAVTLGTLVIQGLTLRPLITWLRLEDDGEVEREVRRARVEMLRAATETMAAAPRDDVTDLLLRRYALLVERAEAARDGRSSTSTGSLDSVRQGNAAKRARILAMRADGTIGDAAFQRVEQELDMEELSITDP